MRANEFIKKYGVEEAKYFVDKVIDHISMGDDFKAEELKRLIESHELVQKMGGIDKARKIAIKEGDLGHIINEGLILRSIRDMESCQ